MQLVGVQDHELSRKRDAPRAAIAERLHAGRGDADRVRVVPMRLERPAREEDLGAFEAGRARPEADQVRAARSFKTIGVDAS
jgi:hypothetical protein